ncbi:MULTISPECIES: methyltransferase domain-containing protein [unclassified Nonomuraea]|uniref:class I SAM-dependent methyltransferase n=1 Tax=unclassified Nonomuraea TaxID=2593643 RepID=UPI0033FBAC53
MPTNSSENEPHRHRGMAESFGADADRYDRTRPRYPEEMIAGIAAAAPGPDVLDVGIGTGIAARQFQAAGCRVSGVDVDARMAELARRDGIEVEVSAFESWDPAGRTFDAVVAGQTWHWIDPVAGADKAARVLRPGGVLALFWNVFQPPDVLRDAFAEVYRRILPDLPALGQAGPAVDLYSSLLDKITDGVRAADAFGEPERRQYAWERVYTRDEWLEQVPTHGPATGLPPERRRELLEGVGAAIDAVGGAFTVHYDVLVLTAVRRAG